MSFETTWPALLSLGPLTLVGSGGEAEIFAIDNQPSLVVKCFKSSVRHELHADGLIRTIELLRQFNDSEREVLATSTVWPQGPVSDGGKLVGLTMRRVDNSYMCKYGLKFEMSETLRTWGHLSYRDRAFSRATIGTDIPNLSLAEHKPTLIKLMHGLARVFEILHARKVVVGDVSANNILWRVEPTVDALVIDCDGFRVAGERAVTSPKQSPDWFDPLLVGDTNIDSDLYKLALAIYRGYFSAELGLPSAHSSLVEDEFDRRVLDMAIRGTTTLDRPSAKEWRLLFDNYLLDVIEKDRRERLAKRGWISWERDGSAVDPKPTTSAPTGRKRVETHWTQ